MNASLQKVVIIASEVAGYLLINYAARNRNSDSNSRLRSKTGHITINVTTGHPVEVSHSSSAGSRTESILKEREDEPQSDPIIYDSITATECYSAKVDLGNGRHTFG